jgi:hypothetical protein
MVPSWGYQGRWRGKQAGYKADLLAADKKIISTNHQALTKPLRI